MTPSYSQQIVDGAQANIDTASRITAVMSEATERLVKLQAEAADVAFAENSRNWQSLLNKTDSAAALEEWPRLYEANARRISQVTRSCFEIVSQTRATVTQLMAELSGAYKEAARQNLDEITEAVKKEGEAAAAGMSEFDETTSGDAAKKSNGG